MHNKHLQESCLNSAFTAERAWAQRSRVRRRNQNLGNKTGQKRERRKEGMKGGREAEEEGRKEKNDDDSVVAVAKSDS